MLQKLQICQSAVCQLQGLGDYCSHFVRNTPPRFWRLISWGLCLGVPKSTNISLQQLMFSRSGWWQRPSRRKKRWLWSNFRCSVCHQTISPHRRYSVTNGRRSSTAWRSSSKNSSTPSGWRFSVTTGRRTERATDSTRVCSRSTSMANKWTGMKRLSIWFLHLTLQSTASPKPHTSKCFMRGNLPWQWT